MKKVFLYSLCMFFLLSASVVATNYYPDPQSCDSIDDIFEDIVNEETDPEQPNPGIRVTSFTDKYVYVADMEMGSDHVAPNVHIQMKVDNLTPSPIRINYSASCIFDIIVRDSEQNIVWQLSSEEPCFHVAFTTQLSSEGSITFNKLVPLVNQKSQEILSPGNYTIELFTTGNVSWNTILPIQLNHAL